ncbi:hypothetical protein TcBrA4_0038830 [Trypanosoma cruzi]|nr:hypothetical protein TcBrA4_0038830 [Trypanosoma cruzi]
MRLCAFLLLVVLLFVALVAGVPAAQAELNCPYCTQKGYPYLCNVPFSESSTCFSNSGEVQCNENKCSCCRKTAAPGCIACEGEEEQEEEEEEEL